MDMSAILTAAKRANAAYLMQEADSRAAFEALGDTWIAMYQNASHQAVLSACPNGETHLSISGTRASAFKFLDVFADMSLEPAPVSGGTVTRGVVEGVQEMWNWVFAVIPSNEVVNVAGHSLGGARTHLTPVYLPLHQIGTLASFEAPKFAQADFYASHAEALAGMACVLNGSDLWASWPWRNVEWNARPLAQHYWLLDDSGAFMMIDGNEWGGGADADDHDITRVIARLEAAVRGTQ
jgi:hypothetical protein